MANTTSTNANGHRLHRNVGAGFAITSRPLPKSSLQTRPDTTNAHMGMSDRPPLRNVRAGFATTSRLLSDPSNQTRPASTNRRTNFTP